MRSRRAGREPSDSLTTFFEDIEGEEYERLDREDEERLVRRMNQQDDEGAREELIRHNLRYAIHEARQFRHQDVAYEDLIGAAIKGLIVAVDHYELGHGAKLISYARWAIRQHLQEAAAKQSGTVSHRAALRTEVWRLRQAKAKLEEDQGYVTNRDLERKLGWDAKKLDRVRKVHNREVSLDDSPYRDPGEVGPHPTRHQRVAPGSHPDQAAELAETKLQAEYLEQVMEKILTERERRILTLYYGLDDGKELTLGEIGDLFGLTLERIRQLRNQALRKLREEAGSELGEFMT